MAVVASIASEALIAASRGGHFAPNMPVSSRSTFGADSWCFSDDDIPRLKLYSHGLLTIVWRGPEADAGCQLPGPVIEVLKSFAFLYHNEPGSVMTRALKETNHPRTVCSALHTVLAFMGHVVEKQGLALGDVDFSLADVKLTHIRLALETWGGANQVLLKRALVALTSPLLRSIHPGLMPLWSAADVESLQFRRPTARERDDKVLPAPLFRLLSNRSTDTVCGFLSLLGIAPHCKEAGVLPPFLQANSHQGGQLYAAYIELRHGRASEKPKSNKGQRGSASSTTLRKYFVRQFNCTPKEVQVYLHQVHRAACTVISMYTAGRFSDLSFFQVGCLRKIRGMWFLMGTHIKHQDINKPMGEDPWPAIPILRDAVQVLTELCRVSLNTHLLAALDGRDKGHSYSRNGLDGAYETFLKEADDDGAWTGVALSSQRFRNTLANQLARADLALPYISRHLKHLHTSLSELPAEVTMTYGGIAQMQVERALQKQELRKVIARSLYGKDAPVAGGGAQKLKTERAEYYRGRMEAGLTQDEVLEELVAMGVPLSSTGLGFCAGKRKVTNKQGELVDPHCIGSQACSPNQCENSLITRVHAAVWRKVAVQNENFTKRPELAYAREEQLAKLQIAQGVLRDLGFRP